MRSALQLLKHSRYSSAKMGSVSEWVYPVNEASEHWTGPPLLDYLRTTDSDDWYLATGFRQMVVGDRIWVYATSPHRRIVGVGLVASGPDALIVDGAIEHRVLITWDRQKNQRLTSNGPSDVLDSTPQTIRRLSTDELQRLRRWRSSADMAAPELERGKLRRQQEVTLRQGQAAFRERLLLAYDGRCAITGCSTAEVLQAAHIEPYDGPATNQTSNGVLLRADLHTLFDKGLLWIEADYSVGLADEVKDPAYRRLAGKTLALPRRSTDRPSKAALREHRQEFGRD